MRPYKKPRINYGSFICNTCDEIIHNEFPIETVDGEIECLECSEELSGSDTHEYEYLGNY